MDAQNDEGLDAFRFCLSMFERLQRIARFARFRFHAAEVVAGGVSQIAHAHKTADTFRFCTKYSTTAVIHTYISVSVALLVS